MYCLHCKYTTKLRNDKEINALFASYKGVQQSLLHQQSNRAPTLQSSHRLQKLLAQDILPQIADVHRWLGGALSHRMHGSLLLWLVQWGPLHPLGGCVGMAGMPHPPTIAQTGCPKILCASVASVEGYLSKKYLCASVSSVGGLLSKKHLCASVQSVGGPYTPKLLWVRCILWEYAVAAWLVQ